MNKPISIITILLITLLSSCERIKTVDKSGKSPIIQHSDYDPEYIIAVFRVKFSINKFIKNLQQPNPRQTLFAIQAKFTDGEYTERCWVNNLKYNENYFYGNINNTPYELTNYKENQSVKIYKYSITDWMIIENHKLIGGYTIKYYRNSLSETERKQYDKSLSYTIE